jgi:predicted nuclease of predicted toxin-antitoxin system
MALGVKLDEDLSPMVAVPLRDAGYAVATVYSQGWSGLKDDELWARVSAEGLFFITADKGFADIRRYVAGRHPGILLLRPSRDSLVEYQALLRQVLAKGQLEALRGNIAVATHSRIRIRRAD